LPEQTKGLYPFSRLSGKANVLIFPSLEAGNIAQKVAQCAGAQATVGPILVGLDKPVNILSPYAGVREIVLTTAITAMLAFTRGKQKGDEFDEMEVQRLVRVGRERAVALDPAERVVRNPGVTEGSPATRDSGHN
jgi:hypothetical protein